MSKDHIVALVALTEEPVISGLVAYTLEKLEQKRGKIYIYDLAVVATKLRRGIAMALIREVKQIAAACSAHVIFIQTDQGNNPAVAMYELVSVQDRCFTSIFRLRASDPSRLVSP